MSGRDPLYDRIRWRCRRGMLELDLVLHAFAARHLGRLGRRELDALCALLERPDPELLAYVMGQRHPEDADERDLVGMMRAVSAGPENRSSCPSGTPRAGSLEQHGARGMTPSARN